MDPISIVLASLTAYALMPGSIPLTTFILYKAYKIYQFYMTKGGRKCRTYKNKDLCLLNFRILSLNKEIELIQKSIKLCSKSKNPKSCRVKLKERIQKILVMVEKLKLKKLKYYSNYKEKNKPNFISRFKKKKFSVKKENKQIIEEYLQYLQKY